VTGNRTGSCDPREETDRPGAGDHDRYHNLDRSGWRKKIISGLVDHADYETVLRQPASKGYRAFAEGARGAGAAGAGVGRRSHRCARASVSANESGVQQRASGGDFEEGGAVDDMRFADRRTLVFHDLDQKMQIDWFPLLGASGPAVVPALASLWCALRCLDTRPASSGPRAASKKSMARSAPTHLDRNARVLGSARRPALSAMEVDDCAAQSAQVFKMPALVGDVAPAQRARITPPRTAALQFRCWYCVSRSCGGKWCGVLSGSWTVARALFQLAAIQNRTSSSASAFEMCSWSNWSDTTGGAIFVGRVMCFVIRRSGEAR